MTRRPGRTGQARRVRHAWRPGEHGRAERAREWFRPGPVGVTSRSGGMTSAISYYLTEAGIGQSTIVHVGGDAVVGLSHPEVVAAFQADEQLYFERKRKRMESWPEKIGIGLPILDEKIHLQFFLSFLGMRKPSYTLFTPEFPVGRMSENIATARNSIVNQALSEKITHLINLE